MKFNLQERAGLKALFRLLIGQLGFLEYSWPSAKSSAKTKVDKKNCFIFSKKKVNVCSNKTL